MSLNWREIDAVLEELDLAGSHIQQVVQSDFRNLYLEVFRPGRRRTVRICLETGFTRIHTTPKRPPRPPVRQRFAQLLNARIKGARITCARQINADRVIRIDLLRGGESTILWIRLWGGAANCIVTDAAGTIVDAFFRRPGRNEVSGQTFMVEDREGSPEHEPRLRKFRTRWDTNVNESVRRHYEEIEEANRRAAAIEAATRTVQNQCASLRRRLADLQDRSSGGEEADRLQTTGELVTANIYRIEPGAHWVEVEDYTRNNATVRIEIDPAKSPGENAERYFSQARRIRRRSATIEDEVANLRARIGELTRIEADLQTMSTSDIERFVADHGATRQTGVSGQPTPGLRFSSHGFTILVGRNARENDELLRRATRGNDVWMHTRDFPGGYVFIRSRHGKSVPLDVLLDAGNLAIHYSRAKSNGRADLYYTQVKYLRRPREGPKGLVLPTQEKNLHVIADEHRLSRLLGRDEP